MGVARCTAGMAQAAASTAQMKRRGAPTYRRSMLAFQLVSLLPTYHLVNGQTRGRAKWAHQVKQAEVEIKVERRSDSLCLDLSLNLNLHRSGGLFQQPVSQAAQAAGKRRQYRNRFSHS